MVDVYGKTITGGICDQTPNQRFCINKFGKSVQDWRITSSECAVILIELTKKNKYSGVDRK